MTDEHSRERLPEPMYKTDYGHMFPIARLLIHRGHLPIRYRERYGFAPQNGHTICYLTHSLTDEDWAAVTARFVLPDNIVWHFGMIRDHDNDVQIQGNEQVIGIDGPVPIDDWIARQDWSNLPADVASAASLRPASTPSE